MEHCKITGVCIISGRLSSRSGKHQIVPGLVLYIVHYTDTCE